MHVAILSLSLGIVATGLPHFSFVHAASIVRLMPNNSGQGIFGFNLFFMVMYFLKALSYKIGISSISSDTTAVVVGTVDNFLPKKYLDLSCEIRTFCLLQLIVSIPPVLFCLCHWCGQLKLPHVDYWFYQVIEWFSFQVEILSTPLHQIFLNFVL